MKKRIIRFTVIAFIFTLLMTLFSGCALKKQSLDNDTASDIKLPSADMKAHTYSDSGIYINGRLVVFNEDGNTDLDLLSVENGITVKVVKDADEQISVNGELVDDSVYLDIAAITRDSVIEISIADGDVVTSHTINLMPSTFLDYSTEGESATEGDFYLSTYDLSTNYIFKLNNQGDLIFYKAITKMDDSGNEVNVNGLDFRKQYTSGNEVRYTYMPYLTDSFANGDCGGINPGCVMVMDENYDVVDQIFYQDENGDEIMIDPHGFIWIDEGHYILAAYKQMVLDVPEDLGSAGNTADLAVLFIEEVKDGNVLWEFNSADYEKFLYESNSINWSEAPEVCQDYVHFNSMHIDADGNLLVSCRHLDSILKISREDGSLIWQLGGDYGDFTLTEDQSFSYQHSIIVTDSGSYMIFDNANTAVSSGNAEYSSVVRMTVDEENLTVTDYVRYNVVDYFSIYMGAIREIDSENAVYLWSVGGNYDIDSETPPEWSMVEYTETDGKDVEYNFCFRFNEGRRRLYCSNKCK